MAKNLGHYLYLSGGMNDAFDPVSLRDDQYAAGINVVSRTGAVAPRPDMPTVPLEFETPWTRSLFERGRFQGASAYRVGDTHTLLCVIAGFVYQIDLQTGRARLLTPNLPLLDQTQPRCFFCQVEEFCVIQDGTSLPVIVQGGTARVGEPPPDGPVPGTIMTYGHGRLFTKVSTRAVVAGDIHNPAKPESVLSTHEHIDLEIGGALAVGADVGEITALLFGASYDTATGDGPLLASGKTGVVTFRVDQPRKDWPQSIFMKTQLMGIGFGGPVAWANMNADTMFWAEGGLRSYSVLQAEVTNARRYVNLSREVPRWVPESDSVFTPHISMAVVDGRLLVTTRGHLVPAEYANGKPVDDVGFRGLMVLDFDRVASTVQQSNMPSPTAAYDGLWTRMLFTQIVATPRGGYCFGKQNGKNALCSIGPDTTGKDDDTPVRCRLFTKGFATKAPPEYEDTPFEKKKLDAAYIWPREIENEVAIKLWAATDASELFAAIAECKISAPMLDWAGHGVPEIGMRQAAGQVAFPAPAFACDPATGRSVLAGHEFQFCIEWVGMMAFSRFMFEATQVQEAAAVRCKDTTKLLPDGGVLRRLRDEDFYFYPESDRWPPRKLLSREEVVPGPVPPVDPLPELQVLAVIPVADIPDDAVFTFSRSARTTTVVGVSGLGMLGMRTTLPPVLFDVVQHRSCVAAGTVASQFAVMALADGQILESSPPRVPGDVFVARSGTSLGEPCLGMAPVDDSTHLCLLGATGLHGPLGYIPYPAGWDELPIAMALFSSTPAFDDALLLTARGALLFRATTGEFQGSLLLGAGELAAPSICVVSSPPPGLKLTAFGTNRGVHVVHTDRSAGQIVPQLFHPTHAPVLGVAQRYPHMYWVEAEPESDSFTIVAAKFDGEARTLTPVAKRVMPGRGAQPGVDRSTVLVGSPTHGVIRIEPPPED